MDPKDKKTDEERGFLTESDVDKIARAIARGTKIDIPPEKAAREAAKKRRTTIILAAVLLGSLVLFFGGVLFKPSESIAFTGAFGSNALIAMEASGGLGQELDANAVGLEIGGYDRPISLTLYLVPGQMSAVEEFFGTKRDQGRLNIEARESLRITFTSTTEMNIVTDHASRVSVSRPSGQGTLESVRLMAVSEESVTSTGALASVVAYPPDRDSYGFEIAVFDPQTNSMRAGSFSLAPVIMNDDSRLTLDISITPRLTSMGEMITVLFSGEPDFRGLLKGSHDPSTQHIVQIQDVPGGVLSLGPANYAMASRDRLDLRLSSPQDIEFVNNDVGFDTSDKSCVGALSNGKIEVRPSFFSSLPSWAQELWRWATFGIATTILGALLKTYVLPS